MSAKKDIILYAGRVLPYTVEEVRAHMKALGKSVRIAVLLDPAIVKEEGHMPKADVDIELCCDTSNEAALAKTIRPYQDHILAVSCRSDFNIPILSNLIPLLPYIKTPTAESLAWSTDKILMRKRLRAYNKKIAPVFLVVSDQTKETIDAVEKKVGYPMIVKPAGLAESKLVSICYHRDELEKVLKKSFRAIESVYKESARIVEPRILVEQFIEGKLYSTDAYVDDVGRAYFCPMVYVKTGAMIGFDDFFGYLQITPPALNPERIDDGFAAARDGIHALGLRNTSAHVELLRTEDAWYVVEIGPRQGGFRHTMYNLSFGIPHSANEILVKIGKKPIIPSSIKAYTAAMKFFAKKEGRLLKLGGIKKAMKLASMKTMNVKKKIGDECRFAKHGGDSVFNVILSNPDRSALLADIRRLEEMIKIETE